MRAWKKYSHAKNQNLRFHQFENVTVFNFNKNYEVINRIKAKTSELHENHWLLIQTEVINNIGECNETNREKIEKSYKTNHS